MRLFLIYLCLTLMLELLSKERLTSLLLVTSESKHFSRNID